MVVISEKLSIALQFENLSIAVQLQKDVTKQMKDIGSKHFSKELEYIFLREITTAGHY